MRPACRARTRIAAAAAIALFLLPGLASAQRGWTGTAVDVSAPGDFADAPKVAVDLGGHVTAVWTRHSQAGIVVEGARWSPSTGRWSAPTALSPTGLSGADVAVAADPTGGAFVVWTTDGGVYASRYLTLDSAWTVASLVASRQYAHDPEVAVDTQGNAFAAWRLDTGAPSEVARYAAATRTWETAVPLSPGWTPTLSVDAAGNALAVWPAGTDAPNVVTAARYSAAGGTWGATAILSAVGIVASPARIGMDAAGNAVAMWSLWSTGNEWLVQSARFTAATGTWGGAVTRWIGGPVSIPDIAMRGSGDALATWASGPHVYVSRYAPGSDTWSAPEPITPPSQPNAYNPRVALDGIGNAIVTWDLDDNRVQTARFAEVGLPWPLVTSAIDLCASCVDPVVVLASTGTGTVVWRSFFGSDALGVRSALWDATPNAPDITDVSPSPGVLSVLYSLPQTSEWSFSPINYEYSLDDGASWVTRSPASVDQPLAIAGLSTGVPYPLRLRAVNGAGAGSPSSRVVVVADAAPHPPADFAVRGIAGNSVTFSWTPPPRSQYEATGYVLEGGLLQGQALASIPIGSAATTLTLAAPTGIFFVRLHTLSLGLFGQPLRSLASNEIQIFVNVQEPPSAPAHLLGLVDGSNLALSWTPTFGGGAPTGHVLHVSGALSGALPLPPGEVFTYSGVPSGTYTLAVSARNAAGSSAPSNPVTLTFPRACSGVPGPPQRLLASLIGRTITVTWDPPETGAAVTGYVLSVAGTYVGAIPTTARALSGAVGPGSYTLSVAAANPCGTGPATLAQTVAIP